MNRLMESVFLLGLGVTLLTGGCPFDLQIDWGPRSGAAEKTADFGSPPVFEADDDWAFPFSESLGEITDQSSPSEPRARFRV